MDGSRSIKFKPQKKQLNRNETPLLKPDMMLITKDVMLPVKLPPPPRKPFSTPQILDTKKKNLKLSRIQRLSSQSLKPFLKPEFLHHNQIEQSLIDMRSKNSSFGTIDGISPIPKTKPLSYCLPRSNVLAKKSYIEKNRRRVSSAKEEPSQRPDSGFSACRKKDRSNANEPAVKTREADNSPTLSAENSLGSGTASLEMESCSSSRVLGALEDALPKLPEINIISSSESENYISSLQECENISVSYDVDQRAESKIVEHIQSESAIGASAELITLKLSLVDGSVNESIENNLDLRSDVCKNKEKCQDWIESLNSIKTNKSDEPRDSDAEKLFVDKEMNDALSCLPLSDKSDKIGIEAAQNNGDINDQITIDVECLLRFLITNICVLEDSNNSGAELKTTNSQATCPISCSLDEDIFGNNLDERRSKIVELKYSLHDLPNFISPTDHLIHSSNYQEPIIDLETKYSWQNFDSSTANVCDNFGVYATRSNGEIETKYSWQRIEEKYEDLNNFSAEEKEEVLKPNINQNEVKICNNSKLTCTEDLCFNEPEYQYSWQKLTSKYLTGDNKEDSSVNRSQPMQNINVNIPINTETKSRKNCFHGREALTYSSNLTSNHTIEENNKLGNDIGRIAVNSPLNHIISSMLSDIKVIDRYAGFGNCGKSYFGSNLRSESIKSSTPYSSMSGIKQIITGLNDMLKKQKNMLGSYARNSSSDEKTDSLLIESTATANRVEKVEIFPSTLHVLGDYIVRDIRPEDMNGSKNFLGLKNDETGSGQSLVNNLAKNSACLDNRGKTIPETNVPVRYAFSNDHMTRSKDENSYELPLDVEDADFPSMTSCPISFNSNSYSSTFESIDNFAPQINFPPKIYEDETVSSKEIEDGSLLPVLGYDSAPTDNWEPIIARMEQPVVSLLDSEPDRCKGKDDAVGSLPYTKSIGLLKPRLQVSFSEAKEAGDSNTREDELETRLESAMSRLKQCEHQVDANWNLDYSVLDDEENISRETKEVQLPEQVEEHIKDIIKSAEEYLAKLEEQLKELRTADDQIINSSERTLKEIDETYQLLMDNLCQEINKRRNLVRLETEVFKYEGLAPLRACKQEVNAQIRSTQHLITLTETMLTHPSTFNKDRLGKIITATSHMGRIPAVPMPEELPYVTFSPPSENVKKEIADRLSCLGCVLRMGPAQFTEVFERPACLQLKWQIVDPEFASEEQTFIVQKALGEVSDPTSPAFETVYIGLEMSCFVKDLPVDHPITLRVGIQVSDTAWSVHRIAQTSIPGYSWDMSNSDYLITNSGRIATKVTQNISTLLSQGAQFDADYIIEFKFLEAASGGREEGIGLVYGPIDATESLKRSGALLITPNGNIFIDGEEKLMQLPKMQLGTRIIFTSEQKDEDTLRMTIECANKAVTYDWTVQRPLHFAARFFEQNKWNFMVK